MADINSVLARVKAEMPGAAGVDVQPFGIVGSALAGLRSALGGGQVQAITNPFTGSVSYDPSVVQGMDETEAGDMLAHELTHSKQAQGRSYLDTIKGFFAPGSYGQDPNEMEAFQVEHQRQARQGRTPGPSPSFTGAPVGTDINLPAMAGLKKAAK